MPDNEKMIKGHCPECGADRNSDILANHVERWTYDEANVWGQVDYRILKCRGCDTVYVQRSEIFSEDMRQYYDTDGEPQSEYIVKNTYWPSPIKRERPSWLNQIHTVDADLYSILCEVYTGLDNDLSLLAATGMRTAFDRATALLDVDPGKNFQQKLEHLLQHGKVGVAEKEALTVLADAGSAAAHRGWKPEPSQLATMMDIVEAFCHRNFILHDQIGKLKPQIPERQKRRSP